MLARINLGWLLVSTFAIWAIAWPLFQDGMFYDGILYAAVSRNLNLGYGTFWNPYLSKTFWANFHEQPPLVFWLQSFFYYLAPQSIYPERMYALCFLLLSMLIITKFWREFSVKNSFWPVFLFLLIPSTRWGFINNIIENTMLVFDLLAVYFFYKSMKKVRGWHFWFLGMLFTFLASFTKGFPGLFPTVTPIVYSIAFNKKWLDKKAWLYSVMAFLGIAWIYVFIFLFEDAQKSYELYFAQRFHDFPETIHATTNNRFEMFLHLSIELLIPIVLCGIVWFIARKVNNSKANPFLQQKQTSLFFLLVAFSASFPLMVTFEQRGFYINTSLPYYSLALAAISYNKLNAFQYKFSISAKRFTLYKRGLALSMLIGVLMVVFYAGKPKRDADKLYDVNIIGSVIGNGGRICTINEFDDWSLRYYLVRYHQISLEPLSDSCQYFMMPRKDNFIPPDAYQKLALQTQYYEVYKKH